MSKPIVSINIKTFDGKSGKVNAIFDTGSYYTLIRENCVPADAAVIKLKNQKFFGTAHKSGQLKIVASLPLILVINGHPVDDGVLVCPDLKSEFIIGAKTMQSWDISIKNKNGQTKIHVGRDMNDPDIQTVL